MVVDLHFPVHNRIEFVRASFAALVANTNWDLVRKLYITDDNSTDGSYEHLTEAIQGLAVPAVIIRDTFGGPVSAMNDVLDHSDATILAKIDSDLVVCPEWLDTMGTVLNANMGLDVLGMEPGFGESVTSRREHTILPASHVGGIGLIRTRIFKHRRPKQSERFFGWTQFQRRNVSCAWITPDLPCFLLDHIDLEPWKSLAAGYIDNGWSRGWSGYFTAGPDYYGWWLKDQVAVA